MPRLAGAPRSGRGQSVGHLGAERPPVADFDGEQGEGEEDRGRRGREHGLCAHEGADEDGHGDERGQDLDERAGGLALQMGLQLVVLLCVQAAERGVVGKGASRRPASR